MSVAYIVQSQATITANGSKVVDIPEGMAGVELQFYVGTNPTGTNPTLVVSVQEVDPVDTTQTLGPNISTIALSATGSDKTVLSGKGGKFKVSWTIGGTSSPIFTKVDILLVPLRVLKCGTIPSRALKASAALPAAGAFESNPTSGNMVFIPHGAEYATIKINYTQGASNGQATHKFFTWDGTDVSQCTDLNGSYNSSDGIVNTSSYTVTLLVRGGALKIGIASAEKGVTGTPGTTASAITFD